MTLTTEVTLPHTGAGRADGMLAEILMDQVNDRGRVPCRSGAARALKFRGPLSVDVKAPVLFIGGSETYGRCVDMSFVERLGQMSDLPVLNMGAVNAGWEALARDPVILMRARQAQLVVLQLMGPHLRSNRFFQVHPRRNDRVVRVMKPLRDLYPQVDFSQVVFVGQMLADLRNQDAAAYRKLQHGLQSGWGQHLRRIQKLYQTPIAFLWIDHGMDPGMGMAQDGLTRRRLRELGLSDIALLRVRPARDGGAMFVHPLGDAVPRIALSEGYHGRIAEALRHWLPDVLKDFPA